MHSMSYDAEGMYAKHINVRHNGRQVGSATVNNGHHMQKLIKACCVDVDTTSTLLALTGTQSV